MCEKNYNLLRPFDLEAAKRGEAVTFKTVPRVLHYVSGPDVGGTVCVKDEGGQFGLYKHEYLRMAPLCWVEGKPVYKGDVLYDKETRIPYKYIAHSIDSYGRLRSDGTTNGTLEDPKYLSWTPPKVKREGWINIYKGNDTYEYVSGDIHKTKSLADMRLASKDRIACIHIEWEE